MDKIQESVRRCSKPERDALHKELDVVFLEKERLEAKLKSVKEAQCGELSIETVESGNFKVEDEAEVESLLLEKAQKLNEITGSCEPTLVFLAVMHQPCYEI